MAREADLNRRDFLRWTGRATVGAALLGGVPALLDACGSSHSTSSGSGTTTKSKAARTITVGGVFSLTGPTATYGQSARNGLQVALDQINSSGGIKSLGGATIHLNVYDAAGSPTTAASQISRAVADGAIATFGCGDGGAALGASQAASQAGVPFLTADPTDTMTTRSLNGIFQVTPLAGTYFHEGVAAMLQFAKDAGQQIKKVAITQSQIATWATLAPSMEPYLRSQGLTVTTHQTYPSTQTDFGPIASAVKGGNPDLVLIFSTAEADAAGVVRALAVANVHPKATCGVIAGFITSNFASDLGQLAENLFGVAQFTSTEPQPTVKSVLTEWSSVEGAGNPINAFGALYVTTGGVLIDALQRAASSDKATVVRALQSTTMKLGDPYVVLPGGVTFSSVGANTTGQGVVFQYKGGQQQPVFPSEVATTKPVFPMPTS